MREEKGLQELVKRYSSPLYWSIEVYRNGHGHFSRNTGVRINTDQSPLNKCWQKLWLGQAVFFHCNNHMKNILCSGCSLVCSRCFCPNAEIILELQVNQTHLQLRLLNSLIRN